MLEADLLYVFCCVARARNFSRAALQLDTVQPVVTRKIGRLETDLGVQLFIRTNRGCELTQAGEILLSQAPDILKQLARVKVEVTNSADIVSGRLAMGMTNSAAGMMAPHLLPAMAQRWPNLRVNVVEAVSRELCDKVLNRELAFAVLHDPPGEDDLVTTPLLMEKLYLVGRPSRNLERLSAPSIRDLVSLPLVLPTGNQTVRNLVEDAFAEINEVVQPLYEASSVGMLRAMAAHGLGYTILTLGSVIEEVNAGKLVAMPFVDKGMSVTLTLITTREHSRLRNVQLVSRLVIDQVRDVVRQGRWPGGPLLLNS